MTTHARPTRRFLVDLAERVAATAAEAGLGYAITAVAGLDPLYALPLTTLLAGLKGAIARKVGDPASASLAE